MHSFNVFGNANTFYFPNLIIPIIMKGHHGENRYFSNFAKTLPLAFYHINE